MTTTHRDVSTYDSFIPSAAMASFLDQNFGDDEESETEFQPGLEQGSDAGDDSGDEEKAPRTKVLEDSDDEDNPPRRNPPQDVNGDSSPPPKPKVRRSSEAEEVEGDEEDEELDGDNGEDDEGEGEDLDNDEEEDEDENEEDEGIRSRPKKRRRGLNAFFEEEAEVDEDDDDVEGEDEGLGNEFIDETHPDDDLPAEGDQDDRHHRELDRRRQAEASMDAEKRAQELKEKYGRRTATSMTSGTFVPQNLLMHDVSKDPTLFNVRCREGKEKEIIRRLMKKFDDLSMQRKPIPIMSAFERSEGPMKGCIFIEAASKMDAEEILNGVPDVYPHSRMKIVPSNEMPDCLRVTKSKELTNGSYVRIRKGLYQGDLGIVESVVPNGLDVEVKLVPRLTYGLDEDDTPRPTANNLPGMDNKRKRPGFGASINIANRPPARLFNEAEAKKKHARLLQPLRNLTGKSFMYRGDQYDDGFLTKNFKLQHLIVENVQPKLEETQMFTKRGQDGSETLDLETLKRSLHDNAEGSYQVGDEVEVFSGEQRGIIGRTERVTGNILSLKVSEGDLSGSIVEVPIRSLRKRFREGDNVIVVGGSKYRDQVGTVIEIKDDKVTILSQDNSTTVTVFSRDLRQASGVAGNTERSKFDVRDLVSLTATTFGCVVGADPQTVRVMDQNGAIVTRLPSSLSKIEVSRHVVAVDKNGSEIRPGDSVKEAGGEAKSGSILHIHRNYLFAHDRTRMIENAGIWVARCGNVIGKSARSGAPLTDLTKMNPAMQVKGLDSSMGPPQKPGLDRLIKKRVKVTRGPYKGHRGIVKDTTAGEARIELESKNKIVNVAKQYVSIIEYVYPPSLHCPQLTVSSPNTQAATPFLEWTKQRGGPPGMQTGFTGSRIPDGGYGGRTPGYAMDGGRTPAWGSSARTPAWGGPGSGSAIDSSRTPAWQGASGSRTSYGGAGNMTSYGGAGNVGGGRTPAWSSNAKTPYAGDSGFGGGSSSGGSAFDAFAAGSRTPAYAGMGSSSRTPAWGGPNAAASAPTPSARGYDAPTPAASAPTPGGNRYDDDPYTPAYTGAPTPGAGFGNVPIDAPTPRFAKAANTEPIKNNRFAQPLDAPTPGDPGAASAPTPYGGGFDAPTPAAGGPRYVEDDDDD